MTVISIICACNRSKNEKSLISKCIGGLDFKIQSCKECNFGGFQNDD